jgi:hypothetical protein
MSAQPWTQPQAGRELRRFVAAGNQDALQGLLRVLFVDAVTMCAQNDLPRIGRAQGQVTRWIARPFDGDSTVATFAEQQVQILGAMLDAGWRVASLRADAAREERAIMTLRQQILDRLAAGPLRPSEIARGLACNPPQISRALRTLVADGELRRAVPANGHDGRAVVYARAQPRHTTKSSAIVA